MQDTGHVLFDSHGCGPERREVLDQQIKTGERSFKEVSEEMWGSLNVCSWPTKFLVALLSVDRSPSTMASRS